MSENSSFVPPDSDLLGLHTRGEILNQHTGWKGASDALTAQRASLQAILQANAERPVLFVGCGTPYYLCLTAAAVYMQRTQRLALAAPASEVILNYSSVMPAGGPPLVITVSRSGETSEVLAAVRKLRKAGAYVLGITVSENTSLAAEADYTLLIPNAQEVGLAQTVSFSAMLLATLGVIALIGDNPLFDQLLGLYHQAGVFVQQTAELVTGSLLQPFLRVFFLGAGPRFGLASEAMMKMKEMALVNAEAFHFLEFRHGPMAMVDSQTVVVGLVSTEGSAAELAVLDDVRALGGRIVAIGPNASARMDSGTVTIDLDSNLSSAALLPFYLPPLQYFAYLQAARGIDPDSPRNLSRFIQLTDTGD